MICYECGDNIYGIYYTMKITEPYFEGEHVGQKVYFHKDCWAGQADIVDRMVCVGWDEL